MRAWWKRLRLWQKLLIGIGVLVVVAGVAGGGGSGTGATSTTAIPGASAETTVAVAASATSSTTVSTSNPVTSTTRREAKMVPTTNATVLVTTTTTAPPPTTSTVPAAFSDGTWLVGDEIQPGTYETVDDVGFFSCYWERLKGVSGDFSDIIANGNGDTHVIVTIGAKDVAFSSSGCGDWEPLTPLSPVPAEIPPGIWAVGSQIRAGRYEATAEDNCYWERLRGFSGGLSDIIANDNATGRVLVQIRSSDKGFASSGCGTWTPLG